MDRENIVPKILLLNIDLEDQLKKDLGSLEEENNISNEREVVDKGVKVVLQSKEKSKYYIFIQS